MIKTRRWTVIGLGLLLLISVLPLLKVGQVHISYNELLAVLNGTSEVGLLQDIVLNLRLPRLLFAILVGAGLALCGYVMQATIQNPLADPYILGISAGASLGAAVAITLQLSLGNLISNKLWISIFAFLGAALAMLLVYLIAHVRGRANTTRLILSGVIINSLCVAFTNLLIYFSKDLEGARNITFWTMGSLSDVQWSQVYILAGVILLALLYFFTQYRNLNLISLGDEAAASLGIDVATKRRTYILFVTFLTGIIVSQCGIIGFVGLVVPHAVRVVCRTSNSNILPVILLSGSLFMLLVDVLSRNIIPHQEVPIGIITSLIGAPVFLFIFIQQK